MLKPLETWLFYIFLFCIPISLRHIFHYEPFNFIEWTSVYIYATDLFLGFLLIFWARSGIRKTLTRADYFLLAFVAIAGISIKNAIDTQVALFQWLKLVEGTVLYFYVKNYALERFELPNAFVALVLGGAFQGIIATIQFIQQGSLGLKYIGESVLIPAMSGIAAFYVEGIKIIRAYGTTPHSNVLAIYLFVALGAFYSIAIYQKRAWWWHIFYAIILWAFLLTFSRVVIGLWLLTFLVRSFLIRFYPKFRKEFWENKMTRTRSLKIFWTTIAVGALFLACYWPYVENRIFISSNDEAVQLRVLYNNESLESGGPTFGRGIGNFVPWLMTQNLHLDRGLYQPVHNMYLLIYSEVGPIGLILFLIFLVLLIHDFYRRTRFKRLYHFSFFLILAVVLISGLFDHFFWTIQTGRLLFWLVLGLIASAK